MEVEKTQNSKSTQAVRDNHIAKYTKKAGARVCVWYVGGIKPHEAERETWYCCTLDRFSADAAQTRATRVILWRVLGVRAAKVETKRRRAGRPGGFGRMW